MKSRLLLLSKSNVYGQLLSAALHLFVLNFFMLSMSCINLSSKMTFTIKYEIFSVIYLIFVIIRIF